MNMVVILHDKRQLTSLIFHISAQTRKQKKMKEGNEQARIQIEISKRNANMATIV